MDMTNGMALSRPPARTPVELINCLQVLAMVSNAHYLHRMTILGALAALAPAVAHDTLCNTMLPVVLSCATDKVRLLYSMPETNVPQ